MMPVIFAVAQVAALWACCWLAWRTGVLEGYSYGRWPDEFRHYRGARVIDKIMAKCERAEKGNR